MGEVHIIQPDNAVKCPGKHNISLLYPPLSTDTLILLGNDDTTDPRCTIKTVPNILQSNPRDHFGPYQGIYLGRKYCT